VSRVLTYERVRAETLKSTFVFPLIGAGIAWAASILFIALGASSEEVNAANFIGQAFTPLSAVFLTIPFAQAFGHEYRDGTIRLALAEYPKRTQLFLAKLLIPSIIAFVATLVTVAVIALIAAIGPNFGYATITGLGSIGGIAAREAVFVVLWGLLVAAITCLTRNMGAGIAGVLIWSLILENLLAVFLIERLPVIADLLPLSQGFGWVQTGTTTLIIPMVVTAAVLTAASYVRFVRSDA
jgi:ABC-2 type transport system permease protein